jgi:hypothetical protein
MVDDDNSITTSSDDESSSDDNDRSKDRSKEITFQEVTCEHFADVQPDTEYATHVRKWTINIPIGLGLCPWAGKSHNRGQLRFVTCPGETSSEVARLVDIEIGLLIGASVLPLSSTLIVCPHVTDWKGDFITFERFVTSGMHEKLKHGKRHMISFVPFHPDFLRWRGLPNNLQVGSVINSFWGMIGSKSVKRGVATIVETENKAFGRQKVKVKFHDMVEGRRQHQFVPIDWIDHSCNGAPLPDNAMHQAPYPTIHLIANKDLLTFSICDISRVKRKNAQRMAKLGWEGLEKRLGK